MLAKRSVLMVTATTMIVCAAISLSDAKPLKNEYERFFQGLSSEEQHWVMKLAAWYHNVETIPLNGGTVGSSNPFQSGERVPDRLITLFLNGDVPRLWQKEFTDWLSAEYNLQDKNYEQFKATGVFCFEGDDCDLINVDNIGGSCCPFG